jgi:hypothetical protein
MGLIVLWEINEGGTNILYAMKLVPPKDLGSIVHPDTIHWKNTQGITIR